MSRELILTDHTREYGWLDVGNGHQLWYERFGRDGGVPYIYLHGGPAQDYKPSHLDIFDPRVHDVVTFSQRGVGRSRYPEGGQLEANTTSDLVQDVGKIARMAGFDKNGFGIFGSSWGTVLGTEVLVGEDAGLVEKAVFSAYHLPTAENNAYPLSPEARQWAPDQQDEFMSHIPQRLRNASHTAIFRYMFEKVLEGGSEAERMALAFGALQFQLARPVDPVDDETRNFYKMLDSPLARRAPHWVKMLTLKTQGRDPLKEAAPPLYYFANNLFLTVDPDDQNHVLNRLDKVQATVDIYGGQEDHNTPPHMGERVVTKLQELGKTAEFTSVSNAGHPRTDRAMFGLLRTALL